MKSILITGGSGFIGSYLVEHWLERGHKVSILTRQPENVLERWPQVSALSNLEDFTDRYDWLINLSGEGIADKRWSDERKQVLYGSRVLLTEDLVSWAKTTNQQFQCVLSGSAVGYYGSYLGGSLRCDEETKAGQYYAAQLCIAWENAANFDDVSDRVVHLRTGLVFGPNGGMLNRLWLPFSMGAGGKIGSGDQVLSWIHIDDYMNAVSYLLEGDLSGPVNMTAPNPASQIEFTRTLAGVLKRPALIPMPSPIARILFGEMADLLLLGQYVVPEKLTNSGFHFEYPDLKSALEDIKMRWE